MNPYNSGHKSHYEDSDGDIRLGECALVLLDMRQDKVGVKFERDGLRAGCQY